MTRLNLVIFLVSLNACYEITDKLPGGAPFAIFRLENSFVRPLLPRHHNYFNVISLFLMARFPLANKIWNIFCRSESNKSIKMTGER